MSGERPMRRLEYARHLFSDYPNALRMRGLGLPVPVPEAYAHGDRRPVLLVPGVYERWHFLRPIADRLNAAGHPVHVVPALGVNSRPIPWSGLRVLDRLRELDLRGVALVGHSKGGLIGKSAMLGDDEGRIDRLVTVATPFAGSRLARYSITPAIRTFSPRHPVIRTLAEELAVNARITSIAPSFDPHIPEGSELPGATNVRVAVIGHFRVLEDPETIEAVLAAVERD